mgnify:CR=1 FL=1
MDIDWLIALGICAATAGVEALCAGRDPMRRLRALKQPRWSPPNWAWVLIGLAWYGIAFTGLVRLLPFWPGSRAPVLLLVALLLGNAAVNIPLFRTRQLGLALACFIPYWLLLAAFLGAACPLDSLTCALFLGYALYQIYAAAWGHALWRLNRARD